MSQSNDSKPDASETTAPAGANEPERAADGGGGSPAPKAATRKRTSARRRPTARAKPQRRTT